MVIYNHKDMAVTFNIEINKTPSKKGTYAIFLRITQNRKHKRIKTGIELKSINDFNLEAKYGSWIRKSEPNYSKWNNNLQDEIEKAKDAYKALKDSGIVSTENIKSVLKAGETSSSFLEYAKHRANEIFNEGGYRNYKRYNGFINKLESYLKTIKKQDISFSEITPSFLLNFKAYLNTLRNTRDLEATLHPNTIAVNFKIFKALINKSIPEGRVKFDKNPFLGFEYAQVKSTTKEKLNESEIKLIEELVLPENTLIWHCRNSFLFSFYMAGIRAGDFIQLRWNNITSEGRLEYRMGKTDKDRSIKLHDKAKEILQHYYKPESKPSDYIFPFLDSSAPYAKNSITPEQKATLPPQTVVKLDSITNSKNSLINKYLNKIAQLAGIEKHISFHIARHSFAKIAKDNKVDNNHLKNLLGHSNIKITEAYMGNFETEETDSVMASIFSKGKTPKEQLKALLEKMNPKEIKTLLENIKK